MEKMLLSQFYNTVFKKSKNERPLLKQPFVILPIKCVLLLIGLIIFGILKILRPVVHIRVGNLIYTRIGHLAANTEMYLRKRKRDKISRREWHVFISGKPANEQLFKMIKRQIPVITNPIGFWMYWVVRQFTKGSDMWIDLPNPHYFHEVGEISPQLKFTTEEENRGKQLLKNMGIESGKFFVCFHVRDKAYLDKQLAFRSRQEWSYQDYRDCDIRNYLPAVKYLASLGMFVLRMGHTVERPLNASNPRIIDYAMQYRSDFGDIYLNAKCKFFLASDGGLSSIPWIFNVPVAYANGIPPLAAAGWRKEDVYIPKKLWLRDEKRFLTFPEILERGVDKWFRTHLYAQAGIEIIENTPEEILALVQEMMARLNGTWATTKGDEDLQRRYWEILPPGHRCYGNGSRLGAEFLRQNQELLGEKTRETISIHP